MKPLLTGSELRHNAQKRLKRFREEQENRGYRTITVFASQELRDELVRLEKEMGLTRQEGLQHIFTQYHETLGIKNDICDDSRVVSSNAVKTPQEQPDIQPDNQDDEPEEQIPGTLPDCYGKKLSVEERDGYLFQVEAMFPGQGMNRKRAEALNQANIKTGRGKEWTPKAVGDNLIHARNRQTS